MRASFAVSVIVSAVIVTVPFSQALVAHGQIDNGLPGPQPIDAGGMILNDTMNRMRLESATGGTKARGNTGRPRLSAATIRFLRRYRPDAPDLPENIAKRNGSKNGALSVKANPAAVAYRPTPQVSQQTREAFLKWATGRNPQEARNLRQVFAQHDPVQIWSGLTRPYGLKTGSLADAFAAYWALNYVMATGRNDIQPAQAVGLRNQINRLFAQNPTAGKSTNAQKQAIAETWMLGFIVQQSAFATAAKQGDAAVLQKLRSAAASRIQSDLHLSTSKLSLNDKGFVVRQ